MYPGKITYPFNLINLDFYIIIILFFKTTYLPIESIYYLFWLPFWPIVILLLVKLTNQINNLNVYSFDYKYHLNKIKCPIRLNSYFCSIKVYIFCLVWLNITIGQVVKNINLVNWINQKRHVILTTKESIPIDQVFYHLMNNEIKLGSLKVMIYNNVCYNEDFHINDTKMELVHLSILVHLLPY